ncbi:MAG: alpha/beta hydrolase [Planctomycetota bacterium]
MEYEARLTPDRPVVVYVHGNRMPAADLIPRFNAIRKAVRPQLCQKGVDWVIFSWPSDKAIKGIDDFRLKASRCDAQGLYLASLLRRHVDHSVPVTVLGYSFGARVATGALHSLGGGSLGGRCLPGASVCNADIRLALIAPAIDARWLTSRGYHERASNNIQRMVLLFNHRDIVLKRYWLLAGRRGGQALGVTGLASLSRNINGASVPFRTRDYSRIIGVRHTELGYYGNGNAAHEVAWLINDRR